MSQHGSPHDFASREYDYVVIGGGTAGLAVAARLSERPHIKVAILEAGPSALDDVDVDEARHVPLPAVKYDWHLESVPQPGLDGRKIGFPRGKVLGGTSALNFMVWTRGLREDYDAWAELGNRGWGWDDLLPFFKKSESFFEPSIVDQKEHHLSMFDAAFHGHGGPVKVAHMDHPPSQKAFLRAMESLGLEVIPGGFSGSNVGVFNAVCSADPKGYIRSYSANSYYRLASARENLYLLTEATVEKVILEREEEEWVAKGAIVRCGGEKITVRATKEVILSAGSFHSPQLLELSGIGSPEVLQAAGIEVKVSNSNVGENLQDHFANLSLYELRGAALESLNPKIPIQCWPPISIAFCPIAKIVSPEKLSSLAAQIPAKIKESKNARDIMVRNMFSPDSRLGPIEIVWVNRQLGVFQGDPMKTYGLMGSFFQYPFSRGSVHIPPKTGSQAVTVDNQSVIDPKMFLGDDELDLELLKAAQLFVDKLCLTEPFAPFVGPRAFPPIEENPKAFHDSIRDTCSSAFHPVGTCSMGGDEGIKAGVVDERLRVYGVKGLRVVDASIMPLHINAHPQSTVYAIAEKAASMILEDLGTH